jgi:hypothetical protein
MDNMILTDECFLLYAIKHYENPQCTSTKEFLEDLQRIKYIKKLVTRYVERGDLKERLILNHLIILHNVFKPEPLVCMLFLKMENYMQYLKPFLILLNILPDQIHNVKERGMIDTTLWQLDPKIINVLRKI